MSADKSFFENFFNEALTQISTDSLNEMRYQGFDPSHFRQTIIRKRFSQKDFLGLLMFYCVRGTKISGKAKTKSTKECSDLIDRLIVAGLKERATDGDANTITIGRIVSAFPEIVASIYAKYPGHVRILCKEVSPKIPNFLKFSAGASLCTSQDMLGDWIIWAVEQDKVINPKKPDAQKVAQFAQIQFANSPHAQNIRQSILDGLNSLVPK